MSNRTNTRPMSRLFNFKISSDTATEIFNVETLNFTENYRSIFRNALLTEKCTPIIITSRHGGRDKVTIYFRCARCSYRYKAAIRTQDIRSAKMNSNSKVRVTISGHYYCSCSKYIHDKK